MMPDRRGLSKGRVTGGLAYFTKLCFPVRNNERNLEARMHGWLNRKYVS